MTGTFPSHKSDKRIDDLSKHQIIPININIKCIDHNSNNNNMKR